MTQKSRRLAGVLLIVLPTVAYGGTALLGLLIHDPRYMANPLRQNLWRAGHAHAAVLLILSLIALRYVDEANLSQGMKAIVRSAIPSAAISRWGSASSADLRRTEPQGSPATVRRRPSGLPIRSR